MNRKAALTLLLVVLTLSICFATAATPSTFTFDGTQHTRNLQLSASVPIVLAASLHSNSSHVLDQLTRQEIYGYIKANPGVHFRGICDALGLSVGVVQYHLSVLENVGLICAYNYGQNKRYFEINAYTKADMQLVSLMRHETTAKILTILAENGSTLHKDIASRLGASSQALSWQMSQLKKTGLINAEKSGINVRYCLNELNTIKSILKIVRS